MVHPGVRVGQKVLAGLAVILSATCAGGEIGPTVETASGALEGVYSSHAPDVLAFRGVPYAAAPVGELRFRPPATPVMWDGVRSAEQIGSPCWQASAPVSGSVFSRGELDISEDCLYLNVFAPVTPVPDGAPVLVWYHGGGNTAGHGGAQIFDGSALAQKGAVVVTVNYRLGVFGFLAHPALTAESDHASSGNYALLDQIASLEWVQQNIAAFGGDPDRVTIFGQSAGSTDVCLLMASPLSRGLFDGVIGHSSGCFNRGSPDLAQAQEAGLARAARVDIHGEGPDAAARLRALGTAELYTGMGGGGGPIVDGWVIPKPAWEIFLAGEHNDVPVIAGSMANEMKSLGAGTPEVPRATFENAIRDSWGEQAEAVLAAYADLIGESTRSARQMVDTDARFAWQSRTWARTLEATGGDSYVYYFSHPNPVFRLYVPEQAELDDFPGGERGMGAFHSGDLAYAFGTVDLVGLGWTDWDREASDIMTSYWVNFARSGDPNGEGLPPWPVYRTADDIVLEFGETVAATAHPRGKQLDIFDAAIPPPTGVRSTSSDDPQVRSPRPGQQVVLVTGSTSGLGREVAGRLGSMGYFVIVHGRNRERGMEVVEAIESEGIGNARFYRADFASFDQIREFGETILRDYDRLDVLVNNAGLGRAPDQRMLSEDGLELRFQVNHLSHFLLTRMFLPRLRANSSARIVNVSSGAQQPIDFDDVMIENDFSGGRAYAQSKLAQVMFTIDLAEELAGTNVIVNALHPATYMDTGMVRRAGLTPRATVGEGADAVMQLITAPDIGSGGYFNGLRPSRANAQAYDEDARAQLRRLSEELTGAP